MIYWVNISYKKHSQNLRYFCSFLVFYNMKMGTTLKPQSSPETNQKINFHLEFRWTININIFSFTRTTSKSKQAVPMGKLKKI